MRLKIILVTVVAALTAASAASAGGHGKMRYTFVGQLTATPSNGLVPITVVGGNHAALKAMLGQPVTQSFAYGTTSEFLKWSGGVPTVVDGSALATGDYVRVNVRAPRGASLSEIEQQAAGIVGDHGTQLFTPDKPLYLFRGTLTSASPGGVAIHVTGGNHRAMRLLIGQPADQTLAVGSDTIFLLWKGKVPTVIDATQLVAGDKVVVRIRAPRGSTLAQVASTAANHVGDREPANAK